MSPARGADASLSILGTRVLRTEDPRFLTTGGVYTEDVLAVFTGPDLAALPLREDAGMLNQEIRQPPLATDIVRFVGRAVAAVVIQEPSRARTPSSRSAPATPVRAETLFTSCDQEIFIDQGTYASLPSDALELKVDLALVTDQFRCTGFAAI